MKTELGKALQEFNDFKNEIKIERKRFDILKNARFKTVHPVNITKIPTGEWTAFDAHTDWKGLEEYSKENNTTSCLFRVNVDSYEMDSHVHEFSDEKLTVVTEGFELVLFLETGKVVVLKYGDSFIIPKNVYHIAWFRKKIKNEEKEMIIHIDWDENMNGGWIANFSK